jgi:cytochrome c
MNSFELNKILGAVLGTCLFLVAMHIASGAIFTPTVPAKPGYEIAVTEEQPDQAAGGQKAQPDVPITQMLASASVPAGQQDSKVCLTCHNLGKGQGSKVGPDLYGVVGRQVASEAGFNYSSALKAKGGTWTFDALNTWLANPRGDVPGTLMTFAGLPSEKQRADVIDYLNSNSDSPLPLPKAAEAAPANPPAATAANPPAAAPANPPAAAPAAPQAPTAPPASGSGLPQTNSPPAGQSSTPPASPPQ